MRRKKKIRKNNHHKLSPLVLVVNGDSKSSFRKADIMIRRVIAVGLLVGAFGCSREDRNEILDRVNDAGKALNGDVDDALPNVVREQRRKERVRQNREWTAENKVAYPKEYCLAQIDRLDKMLFAADAAHHDLSVRMSKARREKAEGETKLEELRDLLGVLKSAYQGASMSNKWPVVVSCYTMKETDVRNKIIDVAEKIAELSARQGSLNVAITKIERKLDQLTGIQKKVSATKERVQVLMRDVDIKVVIDGNDGIESEVNAINDSIGAFGKSSTDISVDDLLQPKVEKDRDRIFKSIMSE